ncbi:hypothetical protein P88_00340 [Erwinia phage phiEt88]|uniref:hypothetical protein n=1 Tax=Erwinia phage phiEt88 TaxID=925984 RepID=UPI0001F1FC72|nr:hypothetical protein ErPhphiEt88_gp34 [Erwinia phage phiEt88]CBX44545.1 hypothetical protein P88_00340 [Erwinia phage phiEt88]
MKLIDLLVRELPGRGEWQDGFSHAAQDKNGDIFLYEEPPALAGAGCWWADEDSLYLPLNCELSDDWNTAVITREQYEAALAVASKPVWDGEGLPPVGCEMEIRFRYDSPPREWFKFKLIGIHNEIAIITLDSENTWKHISKLSNDKVEYRPIRTEAEKMREAISISIIRFLDMETDKEHEFKSRDFMTFMDYVAAGEIPGVRLEDEAGR